MAYHQLMNVTKHLGLRSLIPPHVRLISTSNVNNLDQRWREAKGLHENPNAHGVLTDAPDYTFLDGRPTPYGTRQKQRLFRQKEMAEQIIHLTGEMDFAVERHKQLQIEEEQRKQRILDSKLKPKGLLLLRNKK